MGYNVLLQHNLAHIVSINGIYVAKCFQQLPVGPYLAHAGYAEHTYIKQIRARAYVIWAMHQGSFFCKDIPLACYCINKLKQLTICARALSIPVIKSMAGLGLE